MWYVMQTMTGQEEDLVQLVRKMIPGSLYEDCFVAYHERVWRKQGKSQVHVERLFPGYVFITTQDPKALYLELKKVPAMSKLIAAGRNEFLPLERDEELFFEAMLSAEHIVRLSYVETDGKGGVKHISGPLKAYADRVLRYQFKKRYALIHFPMLGMEKTIALGVILPEDVRQQAVYGKVEAPLTTPEFYTAGEEKKLPLISIGDHIHVISGPFSGMTGVVFGIKKNTVEIGLRLFDQDMTVAVSAGDICVTSYKDDYGKETTEKQVE